MACNSAACQSGCYRDDDSVNEYDQRRSEVQENGGRSNQDSPRCGGASAAAVCIKCKVNETIAATEPNVAGGGGDVGRFCRDCFRGNLFGKFRFAVTSNAMISPSDNVLVAFSGGSSSRVVLEFVHEMQHKAQKNFDASRDRLLPVFGVGSVYIDESTIHPVASDDHDRAINELKLVVSSLAPPKKQFLVVPIESIYSIESSAGQQLTELLRAVNDITGKEDLLNHLRMLLLQKVAFENGYTKIVLGTCTSRIACHVLEATVKGQGFSLAADIQYVDSRWKVPVMLPLRDCLSEELNILCSLDRLKTVETFQPPRSGINGLIASFVKLLKDDNPSRESTIVRTAGKLTPFSFNRIPEEEGNHIDRLASKRRQKKYNLRPNESLPPDSYCLICNSPLKKFTANIYSNRVKNVMDIRTEEIHASTCSSCLYQILPKDPSSLDNFISSLPQPLTSTVKATQELLRDQIQDFLLSDSDDET